MKKTFSIQSVGSVRNLENIGQTPATHETNNQLQIKKDSLSSCLDFSANLFPKQRTLSFS